MSRLWIVTRHEATLAWLLSGRVLTTNGTRYRVSVEVGVPDAGYAEVLTQKWTEGDIWVNVGVRHLPYAVVKGDLAADDIGKADILLGVFPLSLAARAGLAIATEFINAPPRGREVMTVDETVMRLTAYLVETLEEGSLEGWYDEEEDADAAP